MEVASSIMMPNFWIWQMIFSWQIVIKHGFVYMIIYLSANSQTTKLLMVCSTQFSFHSFIVLLIYFILIVLILFVYIVLPFKYNEIIILVLYIFFSLSPFDGLHSMYCIAVQLSLFDKQIHEWWNMLSNKCIKWCTNDASLYLAPIMCSKHCAKHKMVVAK